MPNSDEILKKYSHIKLETLQYDEEVDGGPIPERDKLLDTKEQLKKVFDKRLKAVSSGKTAR
ncbi:MAG: hypothetical protein KU28_01155 [Sulfurovum sp. PC08-66]|nr:MAG: hypothetical protein KU28_01155 [Sulfurovum sp. PC08-66]